MKFLDEINKRKYVDFYCILYKSDYVERATDILHYILFPFSSFYITHFKLYSSLFVATYFCMNLGH